MWFKKKTEVQDTGVKPPWENIDAMPSDKHKSTGRSRLNLFAFTEQATGFGKWGTRFFLVGLAVSIFFISYIIYSTADVKEPPPPRMDRPAIDQFATSTYRAP